MFRKELWSLTTQRLLIVLGLNRVFTGGNLKGNVWGISYRCVTSTEVVPLNPRSACWGLYLQSKQPSGGAIVLLFYFMAAQSYE